MSQILDVRGDIIETFAYDHAGKKAVVTTTQDVEPYFDLNAKEKNLCPKGWAGDMHKVATVPMVLIEQWSKELHCNILEKQNRHLLMMKLRDRDYSKTRTKEGRI